MRLDNVQSFLCAKPRKGLSGGYDRIARATDGIGSTEPVACVTVRNESDTTCRRSPDAIR